MGANVPSDISILPYADDVADFTPRSLNCGGAAGIVGNRSFAGSDGLVPSDATSVTSGAYLACIPSM